MPCIRMPSENKPMLKISYDSETAIATGAILRALNPEQGPTRIIGSSYGFLRTEPHEPECIDAHKYSNPKRVDPIDGERYVKNTIFWVLKKVS